MCCGQIRRVHLVCIHLCVLQWHAVFEEKIILMVMLPNVLHTSINFVFIVFFMCSRNVNHRNEQKSRVLDP